MLSLLVIVQWLSGPRQSRPRRPDLTATAALIIGGCSVTRLAWQGTEPLPYTWGISIADLGWLPQTSRCPWVMASTAKRCGLPKGAGFGILGT